MWSLHLLPCTYSGLPCFARRTSGPKRFRLAKHGPVNFDGEFLEPLGAESRTVPITFVFAGAYFEAHKQLMTLLDQTQLPLVPGALTHPVWGAMAVYCEEYTPNVDFERLVAEIDVTFRRHAIVPEIIVPGFFAPPVPDIDLVPVSLGAYLANLILLLIFQSAWIGALMSLMRLAAAAPEMLGRSVSAATSAFLDWTLSYFDNGFTTETAVHDQIETRFAAADRIEAGLRRQMGVSESVYSALLNSGAGYDAGVYADGRLVAGRANPPARTHAAMTACAVWRSVSALVVAGRLAAAIADADRTGGMDAASADAAVVFMRRRLAMAARLAGGVMPYHAAPMVGEMSRMGDGLARFLADTRLRRPPTRDYTADADCRPLALIALELLGDASRTGEIVALNPHIKLDFNRLPLGTVMKVPA